jgi:hypothetical protein
MPSPEQFRSDYPQLPDAQYQYYQDQYKKVMGQ